MARLGLRRHLHGGDGGPAGLAGHQAEEAEGQSEGESGSDAQRVGITIGCGLPLKTLMLAPRHWVRCIGLLTLPRRKYEEGQVLRAAGVGPHRAGPGAACFGNPAKVGRAPRQVLG